MKPYLTIVVPAYNEEKRITKYLEKIAGYLDREPYPAQVLVVNDGSKDKTARVVQHFCDHNKNFQLLDNKINRGKGAVVRQGILIARGNYILFADADGSTPIEQVEKLLPYIRKGYPVVIGSRYLEHDSIKIPQPFSRYLVARISNFFIQLFLLWGISDTQCGFKLFENRVAKKIFAKQTLVRWGFDFEILTIAKQNSIPICEVAVDWYNKIESKVKVGAIFNTFADLLKVKWNVWRGKYKD